MSSESSRRLDVTATLTLKDRNRGAVKAAVDLSSLEEVVGGDVGGAVVGGGVVGGGVVGVGGAVVRPVVEAGSVGDETGSVGIDSSEVNTLCRDGAELGGALDGSLGVLLELSLSMSFLSLSFLRRRCTPTGVEPIEAWYLD